MSAKSEGGQQELPSIVSWPSGKGPGGASTLDTRNGSHGSSPDFSRASSATADVSGLGGEGGQRSPLSVEGMGSSARSIVSYQKATVQQQTDASSRSVSAMDVYTSLFSGTEYRFLPFLIPLFLTLLLALLPLLGKPHKRPCHRNTGTRKATQKTLPPPKC